MSRRLGRETALQVLFQVDLAKADSEKALKYTCKEFDIADTTCQFAAELVRGVLLNTPTIDEEIRRLAKEWHIDRMSGVDRNLLRLAFYEMLHRPDIPDNVAINEALELAKIYSGEESARFINGILGHFVKEQQKDGLNEDIQPAPSSIASSEDVTSTEGEKHV